MNIYYDSVTSDWYQTSVLTPITIGGDHHHLLYKEAVLQNSLTFHLNEESHHVGPIIGIAAARKADGKIAGNSALFIKLQKKLLSQGGLSYIFTLEDVHDDYIDGYVFLPGMKLWKKIKAPFPDVVYNRIPFRRVEQGDRFRDFSSILKMRNILFFNPCFLDKFELYCLLQKHPLLKGHLPETALAADKQTLYSFLEKHPNAYLKPSHSAKGKGIFRLFFTGTKLNLEGLQRKETYSSFLSFWEEWENELFEKQYLVQEEIKSAKYDGKKFDLRILAHAKKEGYMVTGVGVRQAVEQDITTHVPNGGRLLPYQPFKSNELDRFIALAVNLIGEILTNEYGFFGEFSIDAGIRPDGNYVLYEVNSKPMSFDEMEIEENKIDQLCRLFFQITHFTPRNENQNNAAE